MVGLRLLGLLSYKLRELSCHFAGLAPEYGVHFADVLWRKDGHENTSLLSVLVELGQNKSLSQNLSSDGSGQNWLFKIVDTCDNLLDCLRCCDDNSCRVQNAAVVDKAIIGDLMNPKERIR